MATTEPRITRRGFRRANAPTDALSQIERTAVHYAKQFGASAILLVARPSVYIGPNCSAEDGAWTVETHLNEGPRDQRFWLSTAYPDGAVR